MIIHFIHYPVSAKRFVEPLVSALNNAGFETELWLENRTQLADFISAINCPKQFAKFDVSLNPFAVIKNIFSLTRRLKAVKPAAIHAHQSRASFIPLLSGRLAKVPIRIYHNHGTPYLGHKGIKKWGLWLLEFINCFLATHILTVAPTIRDKMVEDKIVSDKKVLCLGCGSVCGIDLDEFKIENFSDGARNKARQKLGIPENAFAVLYVGRPFVRKGFNTLLKAWDIFCKKQSDAAKILLTAGCDLSDIINTQNPCPETIIPLGYVTDIHQYYAACNIVTLPSWHEGMPYSLLEAAAAKRVIAASDIPGIDSLVKHNETGLLARPKSVEEFVKIIDLLFTQPQLQAELAENARRNIEKYFDRKICEKLLIDYYYDIGIEPEK
ncbi:MAG: glycosyltransferase [Sedimentisphaerales bacterium]|nr:glycosyltransferase [Sedimentisphaerales bacterium]